MIRIGVLGSGSGTNFAALADAVANGSLTGVELALVISDVKNAGILERAASYGIPHRYLPADDYKTKWTARRNRPISTNCARLALIMSSWPASCAC